MSLPPAEMFEPVRGGTRGGQAEFKWSDVSADKDREVSGSASIPIAIFTLFAELPRTQHKRTHWQMAKE